VKDAFVSRLVARVKSLKIGNGLNPGIDIGPLATAKQLETVLTYIEIGRKEAQLACGGERLKGEGYEHGYYVAPAVFTGVTGGMRIAREEIFGPVLAVIPFDDVDDAVRIANDSDYGLAGSVWTSDGDLGMDIARRVRTGTFGVNQYTMDFVAPFGGYKASGVGREFGKEGLEHYLELKSIVPKGSDGVSMAV